jgi:hypothetical protein
MLAVLSVSCATRDQGSPGPCKAAFEKLTEESYEEARSDYARISRNHEKWDCAQAGLQLAAIFTLADLGVQDEAKKQLTAFVNDYPSTDVPQDLKYLYGGKIEGWRQVKVATGPELLPVLEILATLAIVPLAYFALRRRLWPWFKRLFYPRPSLDVQAFDSASTELQSGKGFSMMIEESIMALGETDDGLDLKMVSGPLESLQVPAELLPTPYLKILSQLVGWAIPQRVVTLSGCLQAPRALGVGLTLTLAESWTGRIVATQTLWQADFDGVATSDAPGAAPYYGLADPAASWAFYKLGALYHLPGAG